MEVITSSRSDRETPLWISTSNFGQYRFNVSAIPFKSLYFHALHVNLDSIDARIGA